MIGDDVFQGANASTRRFFGGISRRSLADSFSFEHAAQAATAAQGAPYGSIAQRSDPNQYGSLSSRLFPGQFGPDGALNPEHSADLQQQQVETQRRSLAPPTPQPMMPANGISSYLLNSTLNQPRPQQPRSSDPSSVLEDDEDRDRA